MNANAGKQKRHSDPEEMVFANGPRIFASVFAYSGILVGKNHWYSATPLRLDKPERATSKKSKMLSEVE